MQPMPRTRALCRCLSHVRGSMQSMQRTGEPAYVCPSSKEEAIMLVASEVGARDDDQEEGMVQVSVFKAEETGNCSSGSGEGEPARQVEAWIRDSGASTHMTPSEDCMISSRDCNLKLQIADGSTRSIEGCGDIIFAFRSGNGLVQVLQLGPPPYVTGQVSRRTSQNTLSPSSATFGARSAATPPLPDA